MRQISPRKYGLGQFLIGLGFFVVCAIWFKLGSLVGCLFYFPAVGMPFGVVVMVAGLFTMVTGKVIWDFTKNPQYQRTFNEERAHYERRRTLAQQQEVVGPPPPAPMPSHGAPYGQPQAPVYPPSAPPAPMYAPPSTPQSAMPSSAYPPHAYQQAPASPIPQATQERRSVGGVVIGLLVVLALGVVGLGAVHLFTAPNTQTYTDPGGLFKVTMPFTWSGPFLSMRDNVASLASTDHAVSWGRDQRYFDVAYTGDQVGDQNTLQHVDDAILQTDANITATGLQSPGTLQNQTGPQNVTIGGTTWVEEEADLVDTSGVTRHEVAASTYHDGMLVSIVYGVAHAADFASARSDDFQPILASFRFLK